MILIAQLRFRRRVSAERLARLPLRVPLYPMSSFVALAFLAFVVVLMAFSPDTRVALVIGPLWIAALTVYYHLSQAGRRAPLGAPTDG